MALKNWVFDAFASAIKTFTTGTKRKREAEGDEAMQQSAKLRQAGRGPERLDFSSPAVHGQSQPHNVQQADGQGPRDGERQWRRPAVAGKPPASRLGTQAARRLDDLLSAPPAAAAAEDLAAAGAAAAAAEPAAPPGSNPGALGEPAAKRPFAKQFRPPAHRFLPPPGSSIQLVNVINQVANEPHTLSKLTPAHLYWAQASPLRPHASRGQAKPGKATPASQQQRRLRRLAARARQRELGWEREQEQGIELQPLAGRRQPDADAEALQDAALLRRVVDLSLKQEGHWHRQKAAGPAEEVDLTGDTPAPFTSMLYPSSQQQQAQQGLAQGQLAQQQAQQQRQRVELMPLAAVAALAPAPAVAVVAVEAAAAAQQHRTFDWRRMLRQVAEQQDEAAVEGGLGAELEPSAPSTLLTAPSAGDQQLAAAVAAAELAKVKAAEARHAELRFVAQRHTQLEREQPQRVAQLEEEARQIEEQLAALELQRRQAQQAAQQQAQQQQQEKQASPAAAAPPQRRKQEQQKAAAVTAAAEDDGVVDLLSSDEEEEVEEGAEEEEEEEEEEESEVSSEEEEEEEEGAVRRQLRRVPLDESRLPLHHVPEAWWEEYEAALAPGPLGEVLADDRVSNIALTRDKMGCMDAGKWLNDEVINLYISLLQQRDTARRKQGGDGPRCHFFSTFFLNKLYKDSGQYNYDQVRRWTLPKRLQLAGQASPSILDCDRIIMPVHQGLHWTCAVIDLQHRRLLYYDSLKGEDATCLHNLARYLVDEYRNKKGEERPDILDWPRESPKAIPQQLNGCDCGVFTLAFANCAGRAAPMNFTQQHIQGWRVRIVHEILHLKAE